MNEPIKDGGPAFPQNDAAVNRINNEAGMTLRDYFAAKAMQPLLNGAVMPTKDDRIKWLPILAEIAYEIADAMLAEREKASK